ncbi:L,D-transpeptidase family protein [Devosia rhodophyticola]|uniref:L,D-transpeptidase family protein n=1 Tax=Devosia rhodophyticola TaxID=3026423 RepID=A0ABY7Z1E8_9HYPH|nr:L,D-transpeptidase family protein [Devosia rhodophyticola]WDR07451.1 L,D-transpeptidase family protein [Devosia rhodophyticola]
MPAVLRANATESLADIFSRDRVLRGGEDVEATAEAKALVDTPEPLMSFDTANNLQLAISQYEPFVAAGGWEEIPRDAYRLKLGTSRRAVVSLKRRLMESGDMPTSAKLDEMVDVDTDRAIRAFQARHGLIVTGEVDEATFYAMSVPAADRLNQLYLNLQRVQRLAPNLSDRYVVVNIPAASIEAVELGTVAQRHTAVVGRVDRATPILDSKIYQINFNPYWHVPKSIIRADLTKYMQEDPDYLTKFRIHIYDSKGIEVEPTQIDWTTDDAVNYMFRQEPGAENSMGHVKINFHNKYNVYLHDTPSKSLFGENARFHSSGCVRVSAVNELVSWLLRDNGGWDINNVNGAFDSNERLDVEIKQPVPIHTTYITAWANRYGSVSFRDDVYDYDAQGKVTFEDI